MSARPRNREKRETDEERALCASLLSRMLALAFYRPTREMVEAFTRPQIRTLLREALLLLSERRREVLPDGEAPDVERSGRAWSETFATLELDTLERRHTRFFGHTARATVSPYETEYGQEGLFQQPQQLASLTGLYRSFGLQISQEERERPDHISCELEFLEFLLRKEAYALERRNREMAEASRRALRLLLREHLGRFGRTFARLLKKNDPQGFFGRAGDLLFDFLTLQCRNLGIEAGPSHLPLRAFDDDRIPMACAGETELVELQG